MGYRSFEFLFLDLSKVVRMHLRVIDLDGSVTSQTRLVERLTPEVLDLAAVGPSLRMTCGFGTFDRFSDRLREAMPARSEPNLTFLGSGDFHHVTLALLRQLTEPFNLLIIDKHPDWMRHVPVMHCGTWVHHALRLPNLRRVIHIGGDLDFDNWYRVLAPWPELRSGRVTVIPAYRHFRTGKWADLPHRPLNRPGDPATVREVLDEILHPVRDDFERFPLYISLDKDAMSARDAIVNWDSGTLGFQEIRDILDWFLAAASGRLAGMDVVGDWSPVRLRAGLRTFCDWTMHPSLNVEPHEASRVNQSINESLVGLVQGWTSRQMAPARRLAA